MSFMGRIAVLGVKRSEQYSLSRQSVTKNLTYFSCTLKMGDASGNNTRNLEGNTSHLSIFCTKKGVEESSLKFHLAFSFDRGMKNVI